MARDCARLGPPEVHRDRTPWLPVTSQNTEGCVATERRARHPRPCAPPTLVRTELGALAGTQRALEACAAAPPPAAGSGAAFPAPEQWVRGPAPGSRKANAAGRSRQRSARQPRQQAAGGSRALREPPLPSRAPGGRTATRRGPHAPRAMRQASMALWPPRNPRVENSEAPGTGRQLLYRSQAVPKRYGEPHTNFHTRALSAYTGGLNRQGRPLSRRFHDIQQLCSPAPLGGSGEHLRLRPAG